MVKIMVVVFLFTDSVADLYLLTMKKTENETNKMRSVTSVCVCMCVYLFPLLLWLLLFRLRALFFKPFIFAF